MQKDAFRRLLERILEEAKDASIKEDIKKILIDLGSGSNPTEKLDPSKIPKPVLNRLIDILSRFLLKLGEYKAIRWLWDQLDDLDIDL